MPESTAAPDVPFPRAEVENLSRQEAAARSAAIEVSSYTVDVDLSQAAAEGATTYRVSTRVELSFSAATSDQSVAFLDYAGVSVGSLRINGEDRDPRSDAGPARIRLTGLVDGDNVVEIESVSRFSRSGEGMHRFEDPADGEVYLYTQYEPADCKRVFPVFDQPDLKAQFVFSITGPESWQLRSNSPELTRSPAGEGLVTVTFAPSPRISSYITALLAGPYHRVSDTWSGTTPSGEQVELDLSLLCRASMAEHLDAEEIFTVTSQGLDFFHREFDIAYPWGQGPDGRRKYDQVFVPEYNLGAMENPGLVTFTESYVFDTAATEAQHETRANTILHEMAHMWFGDLVTMHWWDDLWLKESFADYMGTLAVDEATDFETAWVAFANSRKGWAYVQDQLPTTHPIVADIEDLEAADQNFDGITYAKGASVLKQLGAYAGREAFRQAGRRYFARHAFGNASLEDFLRALEETTGRDMRAWALAWLQTAGIPVLGTEVDEDTGLVTIAQTGIDPSTGEQVARPHVIEVGLYTLDGTGSLTRAQSVPAEIAATAPEGRTEVPGIQLPEAGVPRLVLPNEADLTYAKLSLDPASVAASLRYPVGDPLARATVWAALWSMVRDAQLPAEEFVDAVLRLGLQISEVAVVSALLRQADTACERYTPPARRDALEARFAARLAEFLAQTDGGDIQRAAARALALLSRRHGSQLDLLADLLDDRAAARGIDGLDLDEELRWAFLQALAAHGRVPSAQLDAELGHRTTARARIAHRLALAARPESSVKAAALEQAVLGVDADGTELSNDHLTATITGYSADPQRITADWADDYFGALTGVWERMTQGQATRVVRGLFPTADLQHGESAEETAVATRTAQWLEENSTAPAALRRIIIEEQDHLLRALHAQRVAS